MEYPDANHVTDKDADENADENLATTGANHSAGADNFSDSIDFGDGDIEDDTNSARPSAIERQIAAVSGLGYDSPAYQGTAEGGGPRILDYNRQAPPSRRFGLGSFLLLFLILAAGLVVVFTNIGRSPQQTVSAILPPAKQIITTPASAPVATSHPADISQPATSNAISIPIADVSLRNRPELLEQLVQVYRSQLANDPNDATSVAALNRLQAKSLAELETIVAEGNDATSIKSLEIISRLFPDAANNARDKYLAARTANPSEKTNEEAVTKSALVAKPEPAMKSASVTQSESAIKSEKATKSELATKSISPAISASTIATKTTESTASITKDAASSKPEIRTVSITPGTLVDGRFVPRDGGNVFMVELSYSNFSKAFVEKSEATLVAQLSVPGDSLVLAEVPVIISADRGTKSFAIETANVQGYAGGKFQLEFMLNNEFLTARTLRLSKP